MEHAEFDAAFAELPEGYSEGAYEGRRFGVTVRRSGDGRRNSLFARELAGTDIVSFNLYRVTSDRTLLKPCEMSAEKVVAFVLDFRPAPDGQVEVPADRSACDARPPRLRMSLKGIETIATGHWTSSGNEFIFYTSPSVGESVLDPV